jgi:hypothetical protein
VPAGWAALVSAAVTAAAGLFNQRLLAEVLSSLITVAVRAGMRLVQSVQTTSLIFDLLSTTSRVVVRAISTRQAGAGLIVMGLVAAVSLSLLNKLLVSEKESSSW